MKVAKIVILLLIAVCLASAAEAAPAKTRLFVVSSYNREYLWSQSTQKGLCAALLKYGYLDNQEQADTFTINDVVESSRAVIKKEWMDSKSKHSPSDLAQATVRITKVLRAFKPDLVLLGDDNAANYIGNQLLDTAVPVVFWGIDGVPSKYGLVDSMDAPGHNVTGIWQSGYYKESLDLLHRLVPEAKTFAIISCNSESARAKAHIIEALDRKGKLPLKWVGTITTDSFEEFKKKTLEMAKKTDAFFVVNHDTLADEMGNHVDMMTAGNWYLENIKKPETTPEEQFVREGMLCTANDSGYNQAFQAFEMAVRILAKGEKPSSIKPVTPPRGKFIVNRSRAKMLGISLEGKEALFEEGTDEMLALKAKS